MPVQDEESPEEPSQAGRQHPRVLTPASLRMDSRVLFLHTSFVWTTNCIFCILLLHKLSQPWASWWLVFTPLFVGHALHVPLVCWSLCCVYIALRAVAVRSHIVDNTNSLLDSLAMLVVKIEFAHLLNIGQFWYTSLRVVFTPIWAVWVVTLLLVCTKHRRERVIGSQRDLTYIFLLMVAFKVDGASSLPWQIVFIVPWIWLCGVLLLGAVVAVSLTCARGWSRLKELMMPVGFMLLLFSTGVPQFVFVHNLVARLAGDRDIELQAILIPTAVGWAAMWLSSGVLAAGLRSRERARAALLASGAVWTAHEALARGLQPAAMREEEQQRVDAMSEEELVALAQQYMRTRGIPLPTALVRVGPSLFKPTTELTNTNAQQPTGTDDNQPAATNASMQVSVAPAQHKVTADSSPQQPATPIARSEASESMTHYSAVSGSQGKKSPHVVLELPALDTRTLSSPAAGAGMQRGGVCTPASPAVRSGSGGNLQTQLHTQRLGSQHQASLLGPQRAQSSGQQQQLLLPVHHQQQQPTTEGLAGFLQSSSGLAALLGMREAEDHPLQQLPVARASGADQDDGTCVICFDAQASCVLLQCGHGGFCRRCAHLLLVRPPNACPACRQQIEQVAELEHVGRVGQTCTVKQIPLGEDTEEASGV